MSSAPDPAGSEPIEALVEEFLRRHRAGDGTSVESFVAAHADHAPELRELLPTLVALERVKAAKSSTGGGSPRHAMPAIERLGDFRIVREIGRGGMGVVFEAVQESLGRRVALKVLPQASLLSGNQLERFRREAQIASQLHHSNIVPVFGSGESDGFHWYAMQFIAGQSLDQWRDAHAATPPAGSGEWRDRARLVARIGAQAATALHHAHTQGTLHRDIKPANLLLEREEHVWVTDFGLAKALEAEGLTHTGDLLGTLQYMAPEQFAGHYDVRSEVYALGVTLYELLVLRAAFAARTRSELMETIRTKAPRALRQAAPAVPGDLAIVIERAIARDPADRYADAAAFAADLEAFLADRPIAARPHNGLQLTWRWCRRNRGMAALAAATLLAVVGAAITGWIAYGITDEALGRANSAGRASERSLALMRDMLGVVFDGLVGRDPVVALDQDPDTGEQSVVERTVDPRDIKLLQELLARLDGFVAEYEDNQTMRLETARAYRRVGAIQARLGNVEGAATAYDKALERYRDVTGRDVRRELADVHVAYAQLQLRERRPPDGASGQDPRALAEQRLRLAVELLGPDAGADGRPLRFQRAEAHFLLASSLLVEPEPGRRPPLERGREVESRREEGRRELQTARAILAELLQQEPGESRFMALDARCLLLGGRMRGPVERDERETDRRAGIAVFRDLVARHPESDQFAFELCTALLADRRGGPAGGGRLERDAASDIERLREARDLAQRLLERQPDFTEYQTVRLRAATALGRALVRHPAEGAAATAVRTEAESELRRAIGIAEVLAARPSTPPFAVVEGIAARAALAMLLAEAQKLDAAKQEAALVVAALRQFAETGRRLRRLEVNPQDVDDLIALLRRAGANETSGELEDLRERLRLGPERPDRNAQPQRRPR